MLVSLALGVPFSYSGTFRASTLGVHTNITLQPDDRAFVSVSAFGFKENGVARLANDELIFNDSFDTFLRSKRVRIHRVVERTPEHIAVSVSIPLWGKFTVRLLREADLG